MDYSKLSLSELAAIDVANLPIEDLAEYSKALTASAQKVSKQATANKDAIKDKRVADNKTDSTSLTASILGTSLVGNFDKPQKVTGTLQIIDGKLHLTDFTLGSSVRVGGVANSFSKGCKFTIDGSNKFKFTAKSNLNFGEFTVGQEVELTNGKRVLLALGISVKAKAESAEASSTSKLAKLEDSVKARVGVILADGSKATLGELFVEEVEEVEEGFIGPILEVAAD
jgi:hypothetical protein